MRGCGAAGSDLGLRAPRNAPGVVRAAACSTILLLGEVGRRTICCAANAEAAPDVDHLRDVRAAGGGGPGQEPEARPEARALLDGDVQRRLSLRPALRLPAPVVSSI